MNEKTKTGLEILEAAILLGVLGDVLLRETPFGLNVLLFTSALVAALVMLTLRRRSENLSAPTLALHAALVFFAAMFVWRDSAELKIFDALAMLAMLALLTLPTLKINTKLAGVIHYAYAVFWSGINAAFAPFFLFLEDIKWKTIPQTGWSKHLIAVLRGLAIAAPILLIFGALFVAADAVFQGIVEQTFNIQADVIFSHILIAGFLAWIVAGYLRGSLIDGFAKDAAEKLSENAGAVKISPLSITEEIKDESREAAAENKPSPEKKKYDWQTIDNSFLPNAFTLGAVEISVVLGLINLLFLSFVIVQIPYLFGGMDLVQNTPDFKLADYARRGFGELVIVAALVLPILLASHWLLRKDSPISEKIYRVLAGINIGLLFVIMASAAQRLFLLTGNVGYGLTTIRFYPMVVMIWLAVVFVWFCLTVLRGARQNFAWGALWSAMVILGVLHVVSPDDFIARTNLRLMNEGRVFDAYYNSNLSDDAVPILLENLPSMNFEGQCTVKNKLLSRLAETNEELDFRSWNWARYAARVEMTKQKGNLITEDCPAHYESF
ncbi:MAG: DUF4173 domain-containing protein [Acidobacteriota bacterium]|nr:DUF4173 domain-containing protein [Acidobacteriota bacterium]